MERRAEESGELHSADVEIALTTLLLTINRALDRVADEHRVSDGVMTAAILSIAAVKLGHSMPSDPGYEVALAIFLDHANQERRKHIARCPSCRVGA